MIRMCFDPGSGRAGYGRREILTPLSPPPPWRGSEMFSKDPYLKKAADPRRRTIHGSCALKSKTDHN